MKDLFKNISSATSVKLLVLASSVFVLGACSIIPDMPGPIGIPGV